MIYVLVWKNALMSNVLVGGGIYEKVRLISLRDILNFFCYFDLPYFVFERMGVEYMKK